MAGLVPAAALAGTSAYDDAVRDFSDTLETHMSTCERLGRYAEADVARLADTRGVCVAKGTVPGMSRTHDCVRTSGSSHAAGSVSLK